MLKLTRWIADFYLCSWGQVLDSVVPAGVKQRAGTRMVTSFVCAEPSANGLSTARLSAKQKALLEILATAGRPMDAAELTQAADCGTAPLSALRQKGLIRAIHHREAHFTSPAGPTAREDDLTLNSDQKRALDTILAVARAGRHRTVLLHGVTGSGKTEIYIQAIREVVSYGPPGNCAGPRDQPHAANHSPLPPPVRFGRRSAQPFKRRGKALALAAASRPAACRS